MNNHWEDEPDELPSLWDDPLAWMLIVAIEMYWVLFTCIEYVVWFIIGFFEGSK